MGFCKIMEEIFRPDGPIVAAHHQWNLHSHVAWVAQMPSFFVFLESKGKPIAIMGHCLSWQHTWLQKLSELAFWTSHQVLVWIASVDIGQFDQADWQDAKITCGTSLVGP